jgi:hypothetical protein
VEVADDLLAWQQRVVAHVVDRDFDAERFPSVTVESQFAGHPPGFGFESLGWFAKQSLLGRVDDPGSVSIEIDDEVLVFAAAFNWAANALNGMIASGDADRIAGWILDRLYLAGLIQLEQITIRRAGSHSVS